MRMMGVWMWPAVVGRRQCCVKQVGHLRGVNSWTAKLLRVHIGSMYGIRGTISSSAPVTYMSMISNVKPTLMTPFAPFPASLFTASSGCLRRRDNCIVCLCLGGGKGTHHLNCWCGRWRTVHYDFRAGCCGGRTATYARHVVVVVACG